MKKIEEVTLKYKVLENGNFYFSGPPLGVELLEAWIKKEHIREHDTLLETQALALEGRINTTENDSHAHDPARAYEEGWNDANQQAADYLRAQKIALQDNK